MLFWKLFWSIFLFLSIAAFVVLLIVVAIGGFFNILTLLRTLAAEHQQANSQAEDKR